MQSNYFLHFPSCAFSWKQCFALSTGLSIVGGIQYIYLVPTLYLNLHLSTHVNLIVYPFIELNRIRVTSLEDEFMQKSQVRYLLIFFYFFFKSNQNRPQGSSDISELTFEILKNRPQGSSDISELTFEKLKNRPQGSSDISELTFEILKNRPQGSSDISELSFSKLKNRPQGSSDISE